MNELDTKANSKPAVRPVIRQMSVFEKVVFPLDRVITIRASIQLIQDTTTMRFSTRKNREKNTLEVIRVR